MELEIQKEKINIKKRIGEKRKKIIIEKDVILPDNKPDIIKVLSNDSNIYINKKEVMDNKCKIDGGIETRINYLTGEGKCRVLRVEEKFSEVLEIPGLTEVCFVKDDIFVSSCMITIINERKIHYKVEIECCVSVSCAEEVEFISNAGDESKLQTLSQKRNINIFTAHSESKVNLKENVEIEANGENVDIIKFDYEVKNIEKKASYNKILIKADCILKIIYQLESGIVYSKEKQVPLMGFLDIETGNVEETDIIETIFSTKNFNIENNDLKPEINVELELNICADLYKNKEIEILTDLYDLNYKTDFTKQEIIMESGNPRSIQMNHVEQKCIIEDINQIYDSKFIIMNVERKDKDLEIEVKAIYMYSLFESQGINRKEELFKVHIELEKNISNVSIDISSIKTNILPDSSVVSDINIDIYDNSLEEIDVIREINVTEDERDDGYSMIIYFVKPGDTLWKIAKNFKSTVKEIAKINNIENEERINIGDKLYIPRAV